MLSPSIPSIELQFRPDFYDEVINFEPARPKSPTDITETTSNRFIVVRFDPNGLNGEVHSFIRGVNTPPGVSDEELKFWTGDKTREATIWPWFTYETAAQHRLLGPGRLVMQYTMDVKLDHFVRDFL